ncbi:hypothetical protein AAFF_G00395450 [Aldrovandia affinis]|uniref:Uncharacterized protein n=1 Tax=Aldrovandia affinis TaxID=143900 RepID=A0AAD7WKJ4_9TELE|nr:hypothetical protein AAFF_G00395450 [Aldrovandia affinis]
MDEECTPDPLFSIIAVRCRTGRPYKRNPDPFLTLNWTGGFARPQLICAQSNHFLGRTEVRYGLADIGPRSGAAFSFFFDRCRHCERDGDGETSLALHPLPPPGRALLALNVTP